MYIERERIDRTKQLAVGFGITSTDHEMPKKLFKALEDHPGWYGIIFSFKSADVIQDKL